MSLEEIWQALQLYQGEGSKNFDLAGTRVQFYKGAMEIPMAAFYPPAPYDLSDSRLSEFSDLLACHGFVLDCVEENRNYKINRAEDGQYLGRLTPEFLKLHAERTREAGWETFWHVVAPFMGLHRKSPINRATTK